MPSYYPWQNACGHSELEQYANLTCLLCTLFISTCNFGITCNSYSREDFLMLKFVYKVMYLHNFCAHIMNLLLLKLEQTWGQEKSWFSIANYVWLHKGKIMWICSAQKWLSWTLTVFSVQLGYRMTKLWKDKWNVCMIKKKYKKERMWNLQNMYKRRKLKWLQQMICDKVSSSEPVSCEKTSK